MHSQFRRYLLAPLVFLIAGISAPLRADVIVNSGVTPGFEFGGPDIGASLGADNFSIVSTATIDRITFWTTEASDESFLGSFLWWIYADAAGVPGDLKGSGSTLTDTLTRTLLPEKADYGMDHLFNEYKNDIDLTAPLVLDPGAGPANYWLVLHNESAADAGLGLLTFQYKGLYWVYAEDSTGNDGLAQPDGAQAWSETGLDEAYQLSGTGNTNPNLNAVPEPATFGLLATAVGAFGFLRRRLARK